MKAMFGSTIIAEAEESDLISIEGNWYFPPASLKVELVKSPRPYTCPWKGAAQYWSIDDNGKEIRDQAWSYPTPKPTAIERVGKDFSGYIAFWREVTVG